ncbi:MAG: PHP domain-containing protein [Lachnospiraceae bacterium]|nr:PHP domain-containing protein [Lachnospiraceae bacterium]
MVELSYDLHIHSCLSPCGDDDMTPANIVGMAKIIGLDLIAVTDHSSCKNCPAFAAAAEEYGMHILFGMELTTMEEVHVLCYFPTLADALAFDSYVCTQLPDIPNTPSFFGNQIIYDTSDRICGTEDKLLISATMIPLDAVYDLVRQHHGVMVPAHINKTTTSLLGNLGFIPPDSRFSCVEVKNQADWPGLQKEHPYLQNCRMISSSDAHDLNSLHEPLYFLEAEDASPEAVLKSLDHTFTIS